jgi:hypothetical protein
MAQEARWSDPTRFSSRFSFPPACIEKSLRFGKKECPSCRVGCPSRRNLRKDAAFDGVIRAIYPDISKAETTQETYIQEVIKNHNVRKFGEIATKGARQQRDQARRSTKRPASPPPSALYGGQSAGSTVPLSKRPRNPNKPEPISFSIVQHPTLSHSETYGPMFLLKNKFVRTSRYITVLLLKKWLQLKLVQDKQQQAKKEPATGETEEKKESDGDTKMQDAPAEGAAAAAAASSSGAAGDAPAVAAASSSAVDSSAPPSVRFVLYVRAFDTALLAGANSVPEPAGEEVFVPLASDLTLDYIEEHMWNSAGAKGQHETQQLNQKLQALPPGGDVAPLLKEGFLQAFAKCSTHRREKTACPEDCAERVAAWQEYLSVEGEKVKKWREATEVAAKQAAQNAAQAAQLAAQQGADPQMAAMIAVTNTPMPTPVLQPPPIKKKRLVLYYSIVGADGQLLLEAPTIGQGIAEKYVIQEEGEEGERAAQQQGTGPVMAAIAVPPPAAQSGAATPMDIEA